MAQMAHAGAIGDGSGRFAGALQMRRRHVGEPPALAGLQLEAGQGPADGSVSQRIDRIGQAGIAQRLGADQAAGATGAIDDDRGVGIGGQGGGAQDQLGAGHADPARNAHGAVFLEPPGVEHHQIAFGLEESLDLGRGKAGRVRFLFDQLAEGLRGGVDVAEHLAAGGAPGLESAVEHRHRRIAQLRQDLLRSPAQSIAIVIQHHRRVAAWHAVEDFEFQARQRQRRGEQGMSLGEDIFLPQIEQGDFLAADQAAADLGRRHRAVSKRVKREKAGPSLL